MQDKLTAWFLGLPAIVIILILMMAALWWFGVRYIVQREKFWQNQNEAKDAMLKDIIDKLFGLYNDAISRESTVIQELKNMQFKIDEWFRK